MILKVRSSLTLMLNYTVYRVQYSFLGNLSDPLYQAFQPATFAALFLHEWLLLNFQELSRMLLCCFGRCFNEQQKWCWAQERQKHISSASWFYSTRSSWKACKLIFWGCKTLSLRICIRTEWYVLHITYSNSYST